jgi:hypothetical protein
MIRWFFINKNPAIVMLHVPSITLRVFYCTLICNGPYERIMIRSATLQTAHLYVPNLLIKGGIFYVLGKCVGIIPHPFAFFKGLITGKACNAFQAVKIWVVDQIDCFIEIQAAFTA